MAMRRLITQRIASQSDPDSASLDARLAPSPVPAVASTSNPNPSTQSTSPPRRPKFSMAPTPQAELENVRVPRPAGMPEWGPAVVSDQDAPIKGYRKEDRWV